MVEDTGTSVDSARATHLWRNYLFILYVKHDVCRGKLTFWTLQDTKELGVTLLFYIKTLPLLLFDLSLDQDNCTRIQSFRNLRTLWRLWQK